jgi:hypothetical protein
MGFGVELELGVGLEGDGRELGGSRAYRNHCRCNAGDLNRRRFGSTIHLWTSRAALP